MALANLITPFTWTQYSKKLMAKIENPRAWGFFSQEEAEARGMRLVKASEGLIRDGNAVVLYWLVDVDDGIIVDAKFQAYGQSALIGAAEIMCDLLVGKNYDQAKRIGTELIDKAVRDKSDAAAFPKETYPHLNLVLSAVELGSTQCVDLPLASSYVAPPAPLDIGEVREGGYPGWSTFSIEQKLTVIEDVLDQDVRPYIALDGGGVTVMNLVDDRDVIITYQGNCTSCYSSIGTTLSYIQQVLKAKVHPSLVVVPELSEGFGH